MIEIISSTEAMVDTFADFKAVAEGTGQDYGTITTVYFGADIAQTAAPVTVPLTKPDFIIDGTYDGVRHTYTTTGDSASNFITTATPGTDRPALNITMRHMNIVGANYYGAMGSANNINYLNVMFTYSDVDYNGAQANYHRYGTVRYLDCRMAINRNEVAECGRVIIGGDTTIVHTVASYSSFWMTLDTTSQYFRVLAGANVSITARYGVIYVSTGAEFIIEDGASLVISSPYGLAYSSSTYKTFEIGAGATFECKQTIDLQPMINLKGTMTVKENANVFLQRTAGTNPIISASSSSISIRSPERFVMLSSTGNVMSFSGSTHLDIQGMQINYWGTANSLSDPGGFTDIPTYSWRKTPLADQSAEAAYIRGTAATGSFTADADGTNLSAEELTGKPLTGFVLNKAYGCSIGNLPLHADYITNDGWPVTGTTGSGAAVKVSYDAVSVDGTAGPDGAFRIDPGENLTLGTDVTINANLPYLLRSYTASVISPGAIQLTGPPARIWFDLSAKVSLTPLLYGRTEEQWTLKVTDSRARSTSWQLYAGITGDLTSYTAEGEVKCTLPGSLVFVDADSNIGTLSQVPLLIWEGEANNGDLTKEWELTWDPAAGFLLGISSNPFCSGDTYTADITWDIRLI